MSAALVAPGTELRTVPLAMEHQKRTEWCWAAVSVSVNKLFRPASTHTQCDLAASILNQDCCDPETGRRCNHPHTLHTVLGTLHLLAGEPVRKPFAFEEIRKEIDAGRPICVLIRWLDDSGQVSSRGHFIAISGYRITPERIPFLEIADPFYGASMIAYEEFSSPHGGYRHGHGVWYASFNVENKADR
jgi:hypothetical protein